MPSPFPGMDPYLEGTQWTSVHTQLSVEIARQLAPRLRPRYVVRTPRRFVMAATDSEDQITISPASLFPDVGVVESARSPMATSPDLSSSVAVLPLHLPTVMPEAIPQVTIEIRDVSEHQLVTAIEVLSPTNKRNPGRDDYLTRRNRFLMSESHLIEIDLLRRGQRVPMRDPLPQLPYFILLSRAERRPDTEVWPIALDQELPEIPVPLLVGDSDVSLDLQHALSAMYDMFAYDLDIDYSIQPEVALKPEQWAWAQKRIGAQPRT